MNFFDAELKRQQTWRDVTPYLGETERVSPRGPRYVAKKYATIWSGAREDVQAQAFCLNFLAPFRTRPDALADLLAPVAGRGITPIWLPGEDGFVAFEYISGPDYLNEGQKRSRGAQCTSVDAAVGYVRDGRREMLLIEWKYTESYGS